MFECQFKKFMIFENLNWKGMFKDGQFFIKDCLPSLKGYNISGLNEDHRKKKLITRFFLEEDILKCKILDESKLLQQYIEELKGN